MQNHSLAEIRRVIEEHFDPGANLCSTDDPVETLDMIDDLAIADCGEATPLTVQDVAEYLGYLATIGR